MLAYWNTACNYRSVKFYGTDPWRPADTILSTKVTQARRFSSLGFGTKATFKREIKLDHRPKPSIPGAGVVGGAK